MKKYASSVLLLTLFISQSAFSQVGINTTGAAPNSSAMLDVSSSSKGVLLPRVHLQSLVDKTTITAPAPTLLVYNTNTSLNNGAGFYFNAGTAASPNWQPLSEFSIPYYQAGSTTSPVFHLENYNPSPSSGVFRAYTPAGIGLHTESQSGYALESVGKIKITGTSQVPAAGKVLTSDAQGNATWQGAIAFSAHGLVGGGSLEVGTYGGHKAAFATVLYNYGNAYTNANGTPHSTFTVPVHGIYHFDAQLSWEFDTEDFRTFTYVKLLRNGAITNIAEHEVRKLIGVTGNAISFDYELLPGDQVYVYASQASSGNRYLIPNPESNFFNGHLVVKLD